MLASLSLLLPSHTWHIGPPRPRVLALSSARHPSSTMCLLPDDCAPRATQAGAGRLRSGLAPGREVVEGVVSQDGATVDAPVALLVTALAASLGLLMGSQPMDTTTIWINRWT